VSRVRPALVLAGAFAAIVVLVVLAVRFLPAVVPESVRGLDDALLRRAGAPGTRALEIAAVEATFLGARLVGAVLFLVAGALLWTQRHRAAVAFLALAWFGSLLLTRALKAAVSRPRPEAFEWRVDYAFDASFPSGHAVNAVIFYGGLAWAIGAAGAPRPLRIAAWSAAVVAAAAIGASRVYLGVHHPTDVIAGWAAGAAWLAACAAAVRPRATAQRGATAPDMPHSL
jgi:membrane-associated phospholipid phosphatase